MALNQYGWSVEGGRGGRAYFLPIRSEFVQLGVGRGFRSDMVQPGMPFTVGFYDSQGGYEKERGRGG